MTRKYLAVFLVALAAALGSCSRNSVSDPVDQDGASPLEPRGATDAGSIYTVAQYEPAADPAADLADTVSRATAEGKRIILEIGGQW